MRKALRAKEEERKYGKVKAILAYWYLLEKVRRVVRKREKERKYSKVKRREGGEKEILVHWPILEDNVRGEMLWTREDWAEKRV